MVSFAPHPADRRQTLRFAIQQQSRLRLTLDGPSTEDETIGGVTLTDISQQGLMAANAGELVPGAQLMLEVPLVGWREAEVMWIAENRAGCRFLKPLSFEELRLAAASSERLALECPTLASDISKLAVTPVRATEMTALGRPWRWAIGGGLALALLAGAILLLF